jgi:putative ABC transport system permease protein
MQSLLQDVSYAIRQLRKSPGFALTAILTIALGIGANTAIFSLLDQALLRALPVRDPGSLVVLEGTGKAWEGHSSISGGDSEAYFSYPMYKDLRDKNQAFDGLIAMFQTGIGVAWKQQSSLAQAELVSGNYFDVLGVGPAVGRVLTQADDGQKNGNPVAVLSFNYWKRQFGSDPGIVGQTISINGYPFQVVGVARPGFHSAIWGSPADMFVPMAMKPEACAGWDDLDNHKSRWMNIMGRLKPGESRARAEAVMAPLWHALRAEELKAIGHPTPRFVDGFLTHSQMRVLPGATGFSYMRDDVETPLLAVMGMALLVMLMAAVNVASLVLVRAAGRVREFSMRYALGARQGRVVQQLVIEGLLLGAVGGGCALLVAPLASRVLVSLMSSGQGEAPFSTAIDMRILLFNFAVALGVSLFFSLAPVVRFWRPDLVGPMKQQSAASAGGSFAFRRLTVGLQVGLSLLLLICSGLFVRTLENLRNVNVGFATDHLITFNIDPHLAGYKDEQIVPLHTRVVDTLRALPGVSNVGATNDPELADNGESGNISIQGYSAHEDEDMNAEQPSVTAGYFEALKIPLLAGRTFTDHDDPAHPIAVVVNETLARRFFGSAQNAVGHMLAGGAGNHLKYDMQIVGVVHDYLHRNVRGQVKLTVFHAFRQNPGGAGMSYYIRTYSDPAVAESMVRRTMQQIDSRLVVDSLGTMHEQIDRNLTNERMIALLAMSFGALATLLAAIGLYGVLAYSTAQRTREIGIRMALGSDRAQVLRLILRDMLWLAGISIAVTIPLSMLLTRSLGSLLYGVTFADPVTYAGGTLLIAAVALIAASLPARRAASLEPMKALRED